MITREGEIETQWANAMRSTPAKFNAGAQPIGVDSSMPADRGISFDHTTASLWTLRFA